MKRTLFLIVSITVILLFSACVNNKTQSNTGESETLLPITPKESLTSSVSVSTENTDVSNSSDNSEMPVTVPTISIQIGDTVGLAEALGSGSVPVTFQIDK